MASERIRTEEPVKNTIHNLVQTLSVKLDSASRYGLYQDDATKVRSRPVMETPAPPEPEVPDPRPGPEPEPKPPGPPPRPVPSAGAPSD